MSDDSAKFVMPESSPLLARRDVLRIGASGAVALAGLGAVQNALAQCAQQPTQTAGPYWVDEMLNRSDIRSDPTTGVLQAGLPWRIGINVSRRTDGACSPLPGAYVDVWHCNARGVYSDAAARGTVGQRWLRGYQVTDSHGNVQFLSIYPGWYVGRAVRVHVRIRRFSGTTTTLNFVTQLYFNDPITTAIYQREAPYDERPVRSTLNPQDGIFGAGGSQLLFRMADNGTHVISSFNFVVNVATGLVSSEAGIPLPAEDDHKDDFGGGTPPLRLLA